jgi:hypothetical protein
LLLALPITAAASGPHDGFAARLEVRVMPRQIEVGDHCQAVLELSVPEGLAVGPPIFPRWDRTWGEIEILEVGSAERLPSDGGFARFRQTLTLTAFDTGDVTLPPISVELPTAAEVVEVGSDGPIRLSVSSVLPEGEETPAPKPPAPPLPLPVGRTFWWTFAAALGLCLAAAAILVRARRLEMAAGDRAVDPLTALRDALAQLERTEDLHAVIVGLSLELRRFLGRTCGFPAAESTTSEIRRRLQEIALPTVIASRVDSLLKRCDAIKFARAAVEPETCSAAFVETTAVARAIAGHLAPDPESAEAPARRAA